jgi:hypothetical protein
MVWLADLTQVGQASHWSAQLELRAPLIAFTASNPKSILVLRMNYEWRNLKTKKCRKYLRFRGEPTVVVGNSKLGTTSRGRRGGKNRGSRGRQGGVVMTNQWDGRSENVVVGRTRGEKHRRWNVSWMFNTPKVLRGKGPPRDRSLAITGHLMFRGAH